MGKLNIKLTNGVELGNCSNHSKKALLKTLLATTLVWLSIVGLPMMVNGQTIIETKEPPQYTTITKKVLVKPSEIKVIEEPAEYTTVKSRRLIKKRGCGYVGYREMACIQPIPENATIPIAEVQQKLKDRGFYKGAIDNKLNPKTKEAIIEFKKANFLGVEFRITPYMLDILGIKVDTGT